MGVRSLVLVTALALLAAPGILAPASDGPIIHRLAPLEAGGRYVYDVTVVIGEGAARESWTTEGQLTLDIGSPASTRLLDGTSLDAVAITMQRAPAPWDLTGQHGHGHGSDDIHLAEGLPSGGVLILALADGAVVESRTTWTDGPRHEAHAKDDLFASGTHHTVIDRAEETRRHVAPVDSFASGARPGMEWIETGSDGGDTTGLPVARQVGSLDGDRVHDLGAHATRGDGPFDCPTPAPRLPWTERWALPDHVAHIGATLTTHPPEVETWVRPESALPVLMVCTTRVVAERASLSVPVTVAWTLREQVSGDAPVVIHWDAEAAHPTKNAFSNRNRTLPHLLYPLKEALEDVRRHTDARFYAGPVVLEEAKYYPHHWGTYDEKDAPQQTLDTLGKAAFPTTEPQAEPYWTFLLVNATGWTSVAETVRSVDQEGRTISQSSHAAPPSPPKAVLPAHPVDPRAEDVLRTLALDFHGRASGVEEWERQTHATLHYSRSGDGQSGPVVVMTNGDDRDGHQVPPRQQTRRTEDGALIQERTGEPAPGPQAHDAATAPQPSSGTLPTVLPVTQHAGLAAKSGAAFGLALLLVYSWDVLRTLIAKSLLLPLYAKLRKERLLDHKTRDDILQHVRNNPGVHKTEIRKVLAIGLGTTSHHLDVLEKNGLLSSVKAGRRRCYFVREANGRRSQALHAVLSAESTRRVYRTILKTPGIRQRTLAERLKVSQTAVIFHARKLIAVGAIQKERTGREVGYRPAADKP